jgi:hypothetical protein
MTGRVVFQEGDMPTTDERVMRLEAHDEDTRRDVEEIWPILHENARQLALVVQAIPSMQQSIREHDQALWWARGAGKTVLWLIGGGLVSVGALLGLLVKFGGK